MSRNLSRLLVCLTLAAAIFAAYYYALDVGFYGDDWIFFDLAGRLNLNDYLVRYFDPNAQTAWYRPVQGILFRIEYALWGSNTVPYHARNILFHFTNSLWLFAIVECVTRQRFTAFVAALIFATLPTAAIAVFWPGVVDPMVTFFYLAAVWFWLAHLQSMRARDYWIAFAAFLFALLSKEIGATLPITLFLIDRLIAVKPASIAQLTRRYIWFAAVYLLYVPIEFIVTRRSVFVNREGYSASTQLLTNLLDYLSTLVLPWVFIPGLGYLLLVIVAGFLGYLVFVRKKFALIPPIVGATLAVLPVIPFPFVAHRFLYLSLVGSAILFALGLVWLKDRLPNNRFYQTVVLGVLATIVLFGGVGVSDAAFGFGENARIARVPFRNVRQAHPTLPDNTLVYFLYPPVPGPNLSGMFLWYYGPRVFANATDGNTSPRLRDYALTLVQYFDENGNQKEQRVEKELSVHIAPALPVAFSPAIRLESVELISANVLRGDAIILLLNWHALAPIVDDYTVGVSLLDPTGKQVSTYTKEPRQGQSSTSAWMPGQTILDAVQLPVPVEVLLGAYRIEITLFDAASNRQLNVGEQNRIMIDSVRITE